MPSNPLPKDSRSLAALIVVLVALAGYIVLISLGHPAEGDNLLKLAGLPALTLFVGLESDTRGK